VNPAIDQVTEAETKTVADVKKDKIDAVDSLLEAKLAQGIPMLGKMLQVRDKDQARIGNMALRAEFAKGGYVPWDDGSGGSVIWRMADNSDLPLPKADDMIMLATFAGAAVQKLRKASWVHKDAISKMTSIEQVESYDITSGWPSIT
jgi:hypothetical protein